MKRLSVLWLVSWFTCAIVAWRSPSSFHLSTTLIGPRWAHPFGFDAFGRDLLATVLRASLTSALFGLIATFLSILSGIGLGAAIALAPAPFRFASLRFLETLLAFPYLLIALAWAAIQGPGWGTLLAAILVGTLPTFTRLMYVRTRELISEEYVLAAQSLGANPTRILRHHLAPALFSLCRVKIPNLFAAALIAEATLSFLGIGAPIGHDTWGSLLMQGKDYLIEAPHIALSVGLPLVLTTLALQILAAESDQS